MRHAYVVELGLSFLCLLPGGSQILLALIVARVLGPDYGSPGRDDGGDSGTAGCNEGTITIRHI